MHIVLFSFFFFVNLLLSPKYKTLIQSKKKNIKIEKKNYMNGFSSKIHNIRDLKKENKICETFIFHTNLIDKYKNNYNHG